MSPAPIRIILVEEDATMGDVKASAPTLKDLDEQLRSAQRDVTRAEANLERVRRQHADAERPRLKDVRTALAEAGLVMRGAESEGIHDDVVRRLVSALARQGLELTDIHR